MNVKTLTSGALLAMDRYLHIKVGSAVCGVPYFNNKTARGRAAMRVNIGKGSPEEILEEIQSIVLKNRIETGSLADESLKKILVDENIGIDCSGFAYHILDAESRELKKGSLGKRLKFVNCAGLFGKIRCSLRPAENCDVSTIADDWNSRTVSLAEIKPGDMITMLGGTEKEGRDHILVVHQAEYRNGLPVRLDYSHAAAYPEDGPYGNGVKQGSIEIADSSKSILEQRWVENGLEGTDNRILARGKQSRTEIRRFNWL